MSQTPWVLIFMAFIAGMVLPVQFSINAQLRHAIGSPVTASAISFLVGTLALALLMALTKQPAMWKNAFSEPAWIWIGGLIGAFYVFATIILIPHLGAGTTVAWILTGQVIASLVIDHFGLFDVSTHAISAERLLGALLIIVGVFLVQKL